MAGIKVYGFDFVSSGGAITSIDLGSFATDAEACLQARHELLASVKARAVDIWCDGRLVAHIDRSGSSLGCAGAPRRPVVPEPAPSVTDSP